MFRFCCSRVLVYAIINPTFVRLGFLYVLLPHTTSSFCRLKKSSPWSNQHHRNASLPLAEWLLIYFDCKYNSFVFTCFIAWNRILVVLWMELHCFVVKLTNQHQWLQLHNFFCSCMILYDVDYEFPIGFVIISIFFNIVTWR